MSEDIGQNEVLVPERGWDLLHGPTYWPRGRVPFHAELNTRTRIGKHSNRKRKAEKKERNCSLCFGFSL